MMRDLQWVLGVLLIFCTLLWIGIVTGAGALPVLNSGGLSWDTTSAMHWQAQRADLAKVRAVEETKRNAAMMLTLQVMAVAGTAAGVLIVGVTQWGRTVRHESTQRTERIRLCEGYIDRYLPGARAEVRTLPGRGVVVVDHDTQAVTPYAIVRRVMAVQRYDDG